MAFSFGLVGELITATGSIGSPENVKRKLTGPVVALRRKVERALQVLPVQYEDEFQDGTSDSGSLHESQADLPLASDFTTVAPRTRGCLIVAAIFTTFITLSCFLGVYFTVQKDYGYSMGDAFALAGYVVAVGAFVSTGFLGYHYPRCTCWRISRMADTSSDGVSLVDVETPTGPVVFLTSFILSYSSFKL